MSRKEFKDKFYTEERNKNISKNRKGIGLGRKLSEEHRKNVARANIGKNLGRKLSEEQKRKISITKRKAQKHLSFEEKQHLSNINKGKCLSNDTKQKISLANKGKHLSESLKQKISLATKITMNKQEIRQKVSDGLFKAFNNGTWIPYTGFLQGNYKNNFYDSSYELARFLQLEDLKFDYTKRHHIRIAYILNNKSYWYYPDILVNNSILEEIRPIDRMNDEKSKLKFEAAKLYCIKNNLIFRIITEKDLGEYIKKAKKLHLTLTKELL